MKISISKELPLSQTKEAYDALDWVDWVDINDCSEFKVKPCYTASDKRVDDISVNNFYDINGNGLCQARLRRVGELYKFTFNGKIPSRRRLRVFLKGIKFN